MRIPYAISFCLKPQNKIPHISDHSWLLLVISSLYFFLITFFFEIIPKHLSCKAVIFWPEEVLMTLWLLLSSQLCSHTVYQTSLFFKTCSGGRQTLDTVSTCILFWQHTVSEEWEESTSCLQWHIFEVLTLTDFSCPPADEGWYCGQLTPAWRRIHFWASKLTDSLFERCHEDKWAQAGCGEWSIMDIILP